MPVSRPIPTRWVRFVTACLAATSLLVLAAGQQAEPDRLRVGTFDSRAVAVSFARSEMFKS